MITDINQNIISTAKGNVKSINELYEIILKTITNIKYNEL